MTATHERAMTVPLTAPRHRFTVADYYRMAETGILSEESRVELVEGEIVAMSPMGNSHPYAVSVMVRVFGRLIGDRVLLWPQLPLRLDDYSEPLPDLALVRSSTYRHAKPGPADTLLVIEVSDSTLSYDRDFKSMLYAAAGIPEYWVIDLNGGAVLRFSEPAEGKYGSVQSLTQGDRISTRLSGDLEIDVSVEQLLS